MRIGGLRTRAASKAVGGSVLAFCVASVFFLASARLTYAIPLRSISAAGAEFYTERPELAAVYTVDEAVIIGLGAISLSAAAGSRFTESGIRIATAATGASFGLWKGGYADATIAGKFSKDLAITAGSFEAGVNHETTTMYFGLREKAEIGAASFASYTNAAYAWYPTAFMRSDINGLVVVESGAGPTFAGRAAIELKPFAFLGIVGGAGLVSFPIANSITVKGRGMELSYKAGLSLYLEEWASLKYTLQAHSGDRNADLLIHTLVLDLRSVE